MEKLYSRKIELVTWHWSGKHKRVVSVIKYDYAYNAWKPGVNEQIEMQTLNSRRVRDISRTLAFSRNTVISELRKKILLK